MDPAWYVEESVFHDRSQRAMTDQDKLIGTILDGRYSVVRVVGKGGMGTVYEGENVKIGKRVAIKVLLPELIRSDEYVKRFQREARAAAEIGHAHIIDVFDFGTTPDSVPYIIMEYLEGEDLYSVLEREAKLPPERAVDIAGQVLHALSAAHAAGIIHRDLKPENIFLCRRSDVFWEGEPGPRKRDFVKVLDFGISLFRRMNLEEAKITKTGIVFGTPYYMSPEQARASRDIDFRSDVYSVGALLYTMISGERPFEGESAVEILSDVIDGSFKGLLTLEPTCPRGLVDAIHRAMNVNPYGRYDSAIDFMNALLPYTDADTTLPPSDIVARVTAPDAPEVTAPDAPGEEPRRPPKAETPRPSGEARTLKHTAETPKTFTLSTEKPILQSRLPLYVSLAVLAVGAIAVIVLVVAGAGKGKQVQTSPATAPAVQPQPPAEPGDPSIRMRIEITGTPSGASVYLDGHYFGKLPHSTTVRADGEEHTVRAALEGYVTEERSIVFDPAVAVGKIEFSLAAEPGPGKEIKAVQEKKPIKIKIPSADEIYGPATKKKSVKIPSADDLYK